MHPTVLDKMAIQTVVSSQVSANVILTIQPKINTMTKNGQKTKDRLHVQNISKIDVLAYCHQRRIYLIEVPYQCGQ